MKTWSVAVPLDGHGALERMSRRLFEGVVISVSWDACCPARPLTAAILSPGSRGSERSRS